MFPEARFDEPMSRHTSFRIGGPADAYIEVEHWTDLKRIHALAGRADLPLFFLGGGSNLLVLDGGIRGLVLRLRGAFEAIDPLGENGVWVGAGTRVEHLVRWCVFRGLAGAEPLTGIPGTIGGALVMNAGARESGIGGLVRRVEVFEPAGLESARIPRSRLRFGYRSSSLGERLILGAALKLKPGNKVDIIERVQEYRRRRRETQPYQAFTVGSTFKNPPGRFAGKLIQEAGLKGARVGGARVSAVHANFIENTGGAQASDVLSLVDAVRGAVRARSGVELELEMQVVGEYLR
ncbi:MAG: UDP-N-acetylmuramate dehydrogenase [Elusimicrobiota bacterium]